MTWESIRADVRLAIRQCRRAPLFAVLTVASLALGIGANSAMFGVVQAVLLEPLPYADPGALVTIWSDNTKAARRTTRSRRGTTRRSRRRRRSPASKGMYSFLTPVQVRVGGEPEPVLVSQVTPGMFSLLGRTPVVGRKFDDPGAPRRRDPQLPVSGSGGSAAIRPSIGQTLSLSAAPVSAEPIPIIGVMPQDFTFPYGSMLGAPDSRAAVTVDMWWPMSRQTGSAARGPGRPAEPGDPLLRRRRTAARPAPRSIAPAPTSRRSPRSAHWSSPTPTLAGASPSVRCTNRPSARCGRHC